MLDFDHQAKLFRVRVRPPRDQALNLGAKQRAQLFAQQFVDQQKCRG